MVQLSGSMNMKQHYTLLIVCVNNKLRYSMFIQPANYIEETMFGDGDGNKGEQYLI